MKRFLILTLLFMLPRGVSGMANVASEQPEKFNRLYRLVRKNYSGAELRKLFSSPDVARMEEKTDRNLRFLLNPLSIRKQKTQHENAFLKDIDREFIDKGARFFEEHRGIFKEVYHRFKVQPADIIAILNSESSLGSITGSQKIIQIFIGQYFLWEEYIEGFEKEGAFGEKGAMTRAEAMKRGRRLEKSALYNLAALLNHGAEMNFDPAEVRGSRAGAIGYCQFMPASMRFALDGDGDSRIDLFSMPDAIFSVANFLAEHKYRERGREYSFKRYNPDSTYVRGIKKHSEMLKEAGVKI
ncbi:MAG: lytic murein transglycosylase [Candidatus Krumholzibacteriota bacterium]|nr:lytic murein transglycosylase [Candidatus Krumholzibacteriota bacterium]